MSVPILKVLNSGLFTSIQDLGRIKFLRYGVTTSGAMDDFALRIGNRLVGNQQDEAGIEMTFVGGEYLIMQDCIISITGGNLNPKIEGKGVPMWTSVFLRKGSKLSFESAGRGSRSYLCIQGGIDISLVLGSKSTDIKVGFGGYKGRILKPNDIIYKKDDKLDISYVGNYFSPHFEYYSWNLPIVQIRVLLGPELDYFSEKGINTFLNSDYIISTKAERMGYQLDGPKIEHSKKGPNIITSATPVGAVQVPEKGIPIILMRDNQTTGGYPKIATVITPDISVLAQRRTWDKINFSEVDIEEAYRLCKKRENFINSTLLSKIKM